MTAQPLLVVENLRVWFPTRSKKPLPRRDGSYVKAVDDVSFEVKKGQTLGLVGESGCGKSTTARALLRLVEPSAGRIMFDSTDVTRLRRRELCSLRRRMTMIFQDPLGSLNPRNTIAETIAEPLTAHRLRRSSTDRAGRVAELLEMVGLQATHMKRYPHQLSGGQQQRVGIARALACEPDLIVCDEPIASLDVSIQAQILNLLKRLQRELGLTYIFIAHDLSAVQHISDRIAVMYLGRIVEFGDRSTLTEGGPKHPYTEALLSAVPIPNARLERQRKRVLLSGDVPSPLNPPVGCNFSTRCPYVFDPCHKVDPGLQKVGTNQWAACHLHGVEGESSETTSDAPNDQKHH